MNRLAVTAAVSLVVSGFAVIASSQPTGVSDAELKCIKSLDKSGAKLSGTEARETAGCIKLGVRGALGVPPTVEQCFVADAKGRVAKTRNKAIAKELKACVPPGGVPDVFVPDLGGSYFPPVDAPSYNPATDRIFAAPIADAAIDGQIALAGDVFGPNVDTAMNLTGGHASVCQSQILKVLHKCQAAKRKIYHKCKKNVLGNASVQTAEGMVNSCFRSGSGLTLSGLDQNKITAACDGKLGALLTERCSSVSLASTFPGPCSTAGSNASFVLCMVRRVNCRLCQEINLSDQLNSDCDVFDDGTSNGSCTDRLGFCGDGVVDSSLEQCDDGNVDDGDCCSSTCTYEGAGSSCGDQDNNSCTAADTCDGAGTCLPNHVPFGEACDDDGNDCTSDSCNGEGACVHPNLDAGTACGDPTDTACNNPDTCNGTGTCLNNLEAQGTTCTSDNNVCTDDVCDAGGGCGHINNTAPCSDDLFCNGEDTCSNGACTSHAGNPCAGADGDDDCSETCDEDANACTGNDPEGSSCSDGAFCTGTETCTAGVCGGSTGNPCPGADGDGNCSESCDEDANNCEGADANGSSCTDGAFCNGIDSCEAGACSVHAGNPCAGGGECADACNEAVDNCFDSAGTVCADEGNECTDDQCNGAGACVHPNKLPETPCIDDGLECTFDKCDGGGTCGHPAKPMGTACTSDGNGCTDDVCNGGGSCVHNNNTAPCDDGLFCNGTDTCNGGSCVTHAGNPCAGVDGDVNCKETCDETANNCLGNDPNGSACSNGQTCDGADTCQSGTCTPSGVCCGSQNFTFTINSNSGGAFDSAEWPGGTASQNGSVPGCSVTINRPSGNIDLAGTSGPGAFGINSFAGFTNCVGSGGEDGDGCQPVSCPFAGIGYCQSTRPSCTVATNGSGSASYLVSCTDP